MASTHPLSQQIDTIYHRLLAGEADAPSDLIILLLDPLVAALQRKFSALPDANLIIDVVTDSLFRFVQQPDRFQPHRSTLWNYLYMDSLGDLRNAWRKEQRWRKREIVFDPVAHDQPDGNSNIEGAILRKLAPDGLPTGLDTAAFIEQLHTAIPDERDWEVVTLMVQNERKTESYVKILQISHLPFDEQRQRVKQTKDRLRLTLKRWGKKINVQ